MSNRVTPVVRILSLVLLLAVASGCSRRDNTTIIPEGGFPEAAADTRPMVADITAIRLEPTVGGAILHVTGVTETQGWWDVAIRRDPAATEDPSVTRFVLRGRPPPRGGDGAPPPAVGPTALREVDAARFLSNSELTGLRSITVTGAASSRTLRR